MTLHPNHHRLWKLNTGLQATWAMSFSTLPPDSRTLVSKWNTKLALFWKEDFGPLGNSPVLLLLSPGKTPLTTTVAKFLDIVDHVRPFRTTVYTSSVAISSRIMHHVTKLKSSQTGSEGKRVQPGTSKVYLIKWPVSVCVCMCVYIYIYIYITLFFSTFFHLYTL